MNPLHKLLADNRGLGNFRAVDDEEEATIYLYDVIVSDPFWGGVGAEDFVKALNEIKAPQIHLRINSPGGDVFAARTMEQAIREHPSHITAHVDGYAASAASYVALAADEVLINDGGFFMIHKAWTIAWGNADDLMDTATLLEKIDESLVKTYQRETKVDAELIRQWMAEETWFSADEAVEHGFADAIAEPSEKAATNKAWNLSAYAHAPKDARQKNNQQRQIEIHETEKEVETPDNTGYDKHHAHNLMRDPRLRQVA